MQTIWQKTQARIAIEQDFAWDEQGACRFDMDGTLLRSRDRVHVNSWRADLPATEKDRP